ncbi:2'-5' RNA ligase family protein [Nonomuraea endophytica]|uniref:2'-5' RNA ligase n=1 Tax=Nonomuraea endophytica TaxID=714136 RepID=A0A7W8EFK7_9ACTN|nr:2'-5' RNA ligase family protein [Nonomuraea endophytica]MBB5077456.1 2'-5' RNA ligase [Nonomuraea endophytica]
MRRHLSIALRGPAAEPLERLRQVWDPRMADVVPAHVTLVYPEETLDESLLLERAESRFGEQPPFRLSLGGVFAMDGGVFVRVLDVDGAWAGLRRLLLAPPMVPVDFPPHVTIAHPRTSAQGARCHAALAGRELAGEFRVKEIQFTETGAGSFSVLRQFCLGSARTVSGGADRLQGRFLQ